ncbi:MAG: efflux RND transporter periplasmic adaptor subunit [Desulfococcaceae bacterium]
MKPYLRIVSIFSCVVLLWACTDQNPEAGQGGGSASKAAQPPPEVGYISVRPRRIALTNELPGRVKAHRTAEIRPQVSGIIESRLFEEGSLVEAGRQLYQIDPARYEAEYQSAKANLQDAEAELQNAASLARRYERLIDAKAVSAQEYDEAVAGLAKAKAAVALAEAEVRTSKINLDYTKVYAPISGYIGPSSVTEGALVTARQETALATIRQLDPVYVDLSQSAAEAQQIQERLMTDRMAGNTQKKYKVFLLLGNTGETYPHEGTLDATDLFVDRQTGTIRLRSVFPNPNIVLLPGLFVRASMELAGDTETIVIPQKSVVIEPGGTTSVWVIGENSKVEKRDITTGAPYKNNWVVLEGLKTGDRVIVEGTMNLREGAAVKPMKLKVADVTGLQEAPDTLDDRVSPPDDSPRELEEPGETEENSNPDQDQDTSDERGSQMESGVE